MKETLHVKLDIEPFRHELQKYGVNMQKEVAKLVEDVILKIDKRTKEDTPVNFGGLRNSWRFKVSPESANILGEEYTDLNYAKYVEEGTKPHWPPLDPLQTWAKYKFKLDWEEAKQAAYLIGRAISVKGTKAVKMLENAVNEVRPLWEQGLEKILKKFERGEL